MENSSKALEIIKKAVKFLLFFGVGILFVYLSVKDLDAAQWAMLKQSAAEATKGSGWFFLLLAYLSGIGSNYVRALRNRQLLQPLGYEVRRSSVFNSVMVCYLANLVFPRLGEVLRCSYLQHYETVPFQKTLGTVITERAVDICCFAVVLLSAFLLNTNVLSDLVVDEATGTTLGASLSTTLSGWLHNYRFFIIVGLVVVLCIALYMTRERWGKIAFFAKIRNFFGGIWQGLISIKDLRRPSLFIFYSLLIWVLYFTETFVCAQAFPFLSGLSIGMIFTVFAIGNIGFLVGPGGLGAYPLLIAASLVLYKVDYTSGLAVGWVGWGVQTFMVLSVGIVCVVAASLAKRKVQPQDNEQVNP